MRERGVSAPENARDKSFGDKAFRRMPLKPARMPHTGFIFQAMDYTAKGHFVQNSPTSAKIFSNDDAHRPGTEFA